VGKQRRIRGEGWFDQEYAEITDKKNKAYKMMVQRRYTRAVREGKRMYKRKWREYCKEQLKWIEDCNALKESRKFYKQDERRIWG
jgi:hypothetical protein